ncbi:MAG: TraB/GumN family protein [Pseudomonadota bacterium]
MSNALLITLLVAAAAVRADQPVTFAPGPADSPESSASMDSPPLEEVVVSGAFPGPGMWKVTRADDSGGHVLWIVGDAPPLPKRMQWKSSEVEAVVLTAQQILRDSAINMAPDEEIGIFRGLTLLPAILKARKNPDDGKLKDLLPPDLYARWLVQKHEYLGRESGADEWRPIFAAYKLRKAAIDDLKLREKDMVWDVVGKLAARNKIPVDSPLLKFTIKRNELRAKIKEFSRESLSDVECFTATLQLTEALSDRETEGARARAWATGDLQTLDALPVLPTPGLPCAMAVMSSQVAREVIPGDIREQLYRLWTDAAEKSLATNQTTFAIVPLAKLTREQGYLARLRAKGYLVEPPR